MNDYNEGVLEGLRIARDILIDLRGTPEFSSLIDRIAEAIKDVEVAE